jgi:hypothetical protein
MRPSPCTEPSEVGERFIRMRMRLLLLVLAVFAAACANGEAEADAERVLAPVDSVDVRIAESAPPQYFLDVVSALPSGCATFDDYDIERAGDTITVTVWNLDATPEDGACTAIYGTVEHHITLGTNFRSGTTYTVHVNDVTTTFVAQ